MRSKTNLKDLILPEASDKIVETASETVHAPSVLLLPGAFIETLNASIGCSDFLIPRWRKFAIAVLNLYLQETVRKMLIGQTFKRFD